MSKAKAASLVLISKLLKNEDQKQVGVFHKMLARLKCARKFTRRKALICSFIHSFNNDGVPTPCQELCRASKDVQERHNLEIYTQVEQYPLILLDPFLGELG